MSKANGVSWLLREGVPFDSFYAVLSDLKTNVDWSEDSLWSTFLDQWQRDKGEEGDKFLKLWKEEIYPSVSFSDDDYSQLLNSAKFINKGADEIISAIPVDVFKRHLERSNRQNSFLIKNNNVGFVKKLIEHGDDFSYIEEIKKSKYRKENAPAFFSIVSSEMYNVFKSAGVNLDKKSKNGETFLEFVRSRSVDFFQTEKERKSLIKILEEHHLEAAGPEDQKKKRLEFCLDGLAKSKSPSDVKQSLALIQCDKSVRLEGGATLFHYMALMRPKFFTTLFKTLKGQMSDLDILDDSGNGLYHYFLSGDCRVGGKTRLDTSQWHDSVGLIAKSNNKLNLTAREGWVDFERRAADILGRFESSSRLYWIAGSTPVDSCFHDVFFGEHKDKRFEYGTIKDSICHFIAEYVNDAVVNRDLEVLKNKIGQRNRDISFFARPMVSVGETFSVAYNSEDLDYGSCKEIIKAKSLEIAANDKNRSLEERTILKERIIYIHLHVLNTKVKQYKDSSHYEYLVVNQAPKMLNIIERAFENVEKKELFKILETLPSLLDEKTNILLSPLFEKYNLKARFTEDKEQKKKSRSL